MDSEKKIVELEERIKYLEDAIKHIVRSDNNTITITSCSFATLEFGDNCAVNIHNSSAGSVINGTIEDADDVLDELEARIDDAESRMDDLESRIGVNE